MTSETHDSTQATNTVEMPQPTVAPLVLGLGVALAGAGLILGVTFLLVGLVLFFIGLGQWIRALLPGRGHIHEEIDPQKRPAAIQATVGTVHHLGPGVPGYRLRLPVEVHPLSAGLKGGIVGGLVMPLPALLYCFLSGHSIWYPVNLLAGMALPSIGEGSLEAFSLTALLVGLFIHAMISVVMGLMYGVLLPALPTIPTPFAWGAFLMPTLWSTASYLLLLRVDETFRQGIQWQWFILSQFIFGMVAATVVIRTQDKLGHAVSGIVGGLVGGALMPLPAVIWSVSTGHGVWYPLNILAGMLNSEVGKALPEELELYKQEWANVAIGMHLIMSVGFGLFYGLSLSKLRPIPGPMTTGGVLMPILWTGMSYGMMGVLNPVLQENVDWPWFVVSQFVFGIVASIVVIRQEKIAVPLAGMGSDHPPAPSTEQDKAEDGT